MTAWIRTCDLQAVGRILHSTWSAFTGCATREPLVHTFKKRHMHYDAAADQRITAFLKLHVLVCECNDLYMCSLYK
ncbi:UNVERIFIED_CONTAM: hypothetical protein FKN15_050412 [Acipenser sinensis]